MPDRLPKPARQETLLRTTSILCVPALALCLAFAGCGQRGPDGKEHPAVGQKLADLKVQGLTGGAGRLELSELSGRVVFIHFWGTWCPPCVKEFPHIAAIANSYRARDDFTMLAISSRPEIDPDLADLRAETEGFLTKHQLDLPTYADVDDQTRSNFQDAAGWRGYPATMIIDGGGVIRGVWDGYKEGDESEMEGLVAELMESE